MNLKKSVLNLLDDFWLLAVHCEIENVTKVGQFANYSLLIYFKCSCLTYWS